MRCLCAANCVCKLYKVCFTFYFGGSVCRHFHWYIANWGTFVTSVPQLAIYQWSKVCVSLQILNFTKWHSYSWFYTSTVEWILFFGFGIPNSQVKSSNSSPVKLGSTAVSETSSVNSLRTPCKKPKPKNSNRVFHAVRLVQFTIYNTKQWPVACDECRATNKQFTMSFKLRSLKQDRRLPEARRFVFRSVFVCCGVSCHGKSIEHYYYTVQRKRRQVLLNFVFLA